MKRIEFTRFASLSYAGQEAVNTLCTNISFSGENVRRIMITSSHASEGKSYISMNIMRTMARNGKRTVLVDADLRRSYIATQYGMRFEDDEQPMGLAHLLAGMTEQQEVLYATDLQNAYLVPNGREVSNPLPLLNSDRFRSLLLDLEEQFDYVLVDAPPVGTVIDAAQIAKSCDGTLLVVNYNTVHRQELVEARNQLLQTGVPIIGTVLNKVKADDYMGRKYYYKKYYSHYNSYYKKTKKE